MAEPDEDTPPLEAQGSDEGPPSKRQRGFIARQACEYCRQKKTRCDEDFPCGLCRSLGIPCRFAQRKATRNEASLGMIVNILRRIEGKIDEDRAVDRNSLTDNRLNATHSRTILPRSPANSSEILGVPSFLQRRESVVATPTSATDSSPPISFSAHQVLFWPAIQSALPESVKLLCQVNGPNYSTRLEASRPNLQLPTSSDLQSDWLSCLSVATLKELSDVYFSTFNLANPILDQKTYFQRTLGVAIDGNFGICIESCIVLVVMALGVIGQKALVEGGFSAATTPGTSGLAGVQDGDMPGLAFFNEARKRLGFLTCDQGLQACQFYLLSGLFYAEALRPIDWWSMLNKASACSAYFWNNLSRDRDEWMLDMQSRLFWITSMFEAVLTQELNLPPSNSLELEEHIALPKFISVEDIPSFGSFRYPGDDPFFHYHFLSQLAHRLILTRARNSLFHSSPTADYPPEPVEDELIRQLEQWRQRLPPMLQFDPKAPLNRADSPSDILVTAWLHCRYFVARYHIGRPLLHRALQRPSSLTEGHLRKCRDTIAAVLNWASILQVANSMKSCNPLRFFVSGQLFGQICVIFALSVSPYQHIRDIVSDVDLKWKSFALDYLEESAAHSPTIEQDYQIAKILFFTKDAPAPMGGLLSQGIVANGFVFTSGAIAQDPITGQVIDGDIEEHTHRCIKNLRAILEAAGSSLNDVVEVTIYMASSEKFARMNEVYKTYWGDIKPARTTVFMSELPPKTQLEMKCVGLVTRQEVAKSKV
ncbi:Zn(2)-C6 fungal-type domain-containing protein [Fusarium sp. Ph1]|nr:Zn(2)-C6 fungal-type domain-containing protein [Fusarium sp. Ph1]